MRAALALILFVTACGSPLGATGPSASTSTAPSATACEPTTHKDSTGVITANGVFGVIGDTAMSSAFAMNEPLLIVRRGAKETDGLALRFDDIGHSSPARSVSYGVVARDRENPWGAVAFEAGWKPIGFAGSCWRLMADGEDSGLVLFVRP
jgi:hypothetical protein